MTAKFLTDENNPQMMIRARINVKGRVQKAGYKDTVDEAAYYLDVKGYVKNLDDGTVEVVCEGDKKDIEELVKKTRVREYPIFVESVKVEYSEATGEFKQFDIVREKDIVEATYDRMDMAARYMRNMHTEMKDMHHDLKDGQDKMIGKQDETISAIKGLDKKQDKTIEVIGNRFDSMDTKYGDIAKTLNSVNDKLDFLAHLFEKLVNHIVKEEK